MRTLRRLALASLVVFGIGTASACVTVKLEPKTHEEIQALTEQVKRFMDSLQRIEDEIFPSKKKE